VGTKFETSNLVPTTHLEIIMNLYPTPVPRSRVPAYFLGRPSAMYAERFRPSPLGFWNASRRTGKGLTSDLTNTQ
jgi:hypothetical protein